MKKTTANRGVTGCAIRSKINSLRSGKIALRYFEERFGKVQFYKVPNGPHYNMFPEKSAGFADDVICVASSIEGLISYMQGAIDVKNGEIERQMKKNEK